MTDTTATLANARAIEAYGRVMFSKGLKVRAQAMFAQASKLRVQVEMATMEATYAKAA